MKLLKIEGDEALFLGAENDYQPINKLSKEDLMRLAGLALTDDAEIDPYDETRVKNHAHQIIYKSVSLKLIDLHDRRKEFLDQAERLYLDQYEKYRSDSN